MRAKRTKADKVFFICLRGLLYSEVAPQTLDKKEEKLINDLTELLRLSFCCLSLRFFAMSGGDYRGVDGMRKGNLSGRRERIAQAKEQQAALEKENASIKTEHDAALRFANELREANRTLHARP